MTVSNDIVAPVRVRLLDNPIGRFAIVQDARGTITTGWWPADDAVVRSAEADDALQPDLADRLARYFAGEPVTFDDWPLPQGRPFFVRCWRACQQVPAGETISYGNLAQRAGSTAAAARAAGQAMRHNPLPIIVPCHRVVNAAGGLHGFAGSTDPAGSPLAVKARLLALESSMRPVACGC